MALKVHAFSIFYRIQGTKNKAVKKFYVIIICLEISKTVTFKLNTPYNVLIVFGTFTST